MDPFSLIGTLNDAVARFGADVGHLWKVSVLIVVATVVAGRVVFSWVGGAITAGEGFVVLVGLIVAEAAAVNWVRDFQGVRFALLAALPLALWAGVEVLLRVGHREARQSTLRRDMQRYEAALRRDPRNAAALVLLGDSYVRLNQPERAERYYRGALAAEGDSYEVRYKLQRAQRLSRAR